MRSYSSPLQASDVTSRLSTSQQRRSATRGLCIQALSEG